MVKRIVDLAVVAAAVAVVLFCLFSEAMKTPNATKMIVNKQRNSYRLLFYISSLFVVFSCSHSKWVAVDVGEAVRWRLCAPGH